MEVLLESKSEAAFPVQNHISDVSEFIVKEWRILFEVQAALRVQFIREHGMLMPNSMEWNVVIHTMQLYSRHYAEKLIHELYCWRLCTLLTTRLALDSNVSVSAPLPIVSSSIPLESSGLNLIFSDVLGYSSYNRHFPQIISAKFDHDLCTLLNTKPIENHFAHASYSAPANSSTIDPFQLAYLSIEIVFCQALLMVLRVHHAANNNLDPVILGVIDSDAYDYIYRQPPAHHYTRTFWQRLLKPEVPYRDIYSQSKDSTKNLRIGHEIFCSNILFFFWTEIMGTMSSFSCIHSSSDNNFPLICSRLNVTFLHMLDVMQYSGKLIVSKIVAQRFLRAISCLELDIFQPHRLTQSINVVSTLLQFHKNAHGLPKIKNAICQTLCSLLYPIAYIQFDENTNYSSWFNLNANVYDRMSTWGATMSCCCCLGSRPKHEAISLPVMTVTLCVCEKEFFLSHYRHLTQLLLDYREINLNLALSCLQLLVYVYLDKNASRRETTSHFLQHLRSPLFFNGFDPFSIHSDKSSISINPDYSFLKDEISEKAKDPVLSESIHFAGTFTNFGTDKNYMNSLCSQSMAHELILASALTICTSSKSFALETIAFGILLSSPVSNSMSTNALLATKLITYILFSGVDAAELRLRDHRNMTNINTTSRGYEIEQILHSDVSNFGKIYPDDVWNRPNEDFEAENAIVTHDPWKSWSFNVNSAHNTAFLYSDSYERLHAIYIAATIARSEKPVGDRRATFSPTTLATAMKDTINKQGHLNWRSNNYGITFKSPSQVMLDILLRSDTKNDSAKIDSRFSAATCKKLQSLMSKSLSASASWLSKNSPYSTKNLCKSVERTNDWKIVSSVFCHTILWITHVWPVGISSESVVQLLCEATIHPEPSICQAGKFVLLHLSKSRPDLRCLIVSILFQVLSHLPDSTHFISSYSDSEINALENIDKAGNSVSNATSMLKLIRFGWNLLIEILENWIKLLSECYSESEIPIANFGELNVIGIQASVISSLCTSDGLVRQLVWKSMALVRDLVKLLHSRAMILYSRNLVYQISWIADSELIIDVIECNFEWLIADVISRIDMSDSTLIREQMANTSRDDTSLLPDHFKNMKHSELFSLWISSSDALHQQYWSVCFAFVLELLSNKSDILTLASVEMLYKLKTVIISATSSNSHYEHSQKSPELNSDSFFPSLYPMNTHSNGFDVLHVAASDRYFTYPRFASSSMLSSMPTTQAVFSLLDSGPVAILPYWRNVCIFSSVCAVNFYGSSISIFDRLMPLLRSEKLFIRSFGVLALGFASSACIPSLLSSLESVEASMRVVVKEKTVVKSQEDCFPCGCLLNFLSSCIINNEEVSNSSFSNSSFSSISNLPSEQAFSSSTVTPATLWGQLGHVYRLIAEQMKLRNQRLFNDDAIKKRFLHFLQSAFQFLSQSGNELRWDLLPLRIHFCVIVQHIAELVFISSPKGINGAKKRKSTGLSINVNDSQEEKVEMPLNTPLNGRNSRLGTPSNKNSKVVSFRFVDENDVENNDIRKSISDILRSPLAAKNINIVLTTPKSGGELKKDSNVDNSKKSPNIRVSKSPNKNVSNSPIVPKPFSPLGKSRISSSLENIAPLDPELRHRLFEFLLPWCGFGPSSAVYRQNLEKHRVMMLSHFKDNIARIKIEKLFNQQQQILSRQALRGMISLLQGSIFDSNRSAASKPLNQPKLKRLSIVSEDKKHFLSNSILSRVILPWLCDLSRCTSDTIPESIPSEALDKFMQNNLDLWPELIHFCYSPNLLIAKRFFLALSRLWCSRSVAYSLPVILNLIIYKLGDSCLEVRNMALEMLPTLFKRHPGKISGEEFSMKPVFSGQLSDSFRSTQVVISSFLVKEYGSHVHYILTDAAERYNEMCFSLTTEKIDPNALLSNVQYIRQLINTSFSSLELLSIQKQMLQYLSPWFSHIKLNESRSDSLLIFSVLLSTSFPWMQTVDIGNSSFSTVSISTALELISSEVSSLWFEVSQKKQNISFVLKHLIMYLQGKIKSSDMGSFTSVTVQYAENRMFFLETVKRIALFVSSASHRKTILALIQLQREELHDDSALELLNEQIENKDLSLSYSELYPLENMFSKEIIVAKFRINTAYNDLATESWHLLKSEHWALILLSEVAFEFDFFSEQAVVEKNSQLFEEESFLLHVAILSADHCIPVLRNHVQGLLLHILHSFLSSETDILNQKKDSFQYMNLNLIQWILNSDCRPLWKNEIISYNSFEVKSTIHVNHFVSHFLTILDLHFSQSKNIDKIGTIANVIKMWVKISLTWFSYSTNSHEVCRSLQVFRALWKWAENKQIKAEIFEDMNILGTLTDLLLVESMPIQAEALYSIELIIPKLTPKSIMKVPQLLYRCYECLLKASETEDIYVSVYAPCISVLTLLFHGVPFADRHVQSYYASSITDKEMSIQSAVIRGMPNFLCRSYCVNFLNKFMIFPWLSIWDCSTIDPVLRNFTAQLPWFCLQLSDSTLSKTAIISAQHFEKCLITVGRLDLAYVIHRYHNSYYRSVSCFLDDIRRPFLTWIKSSQFSIEYEISVCLELAYSIKISDYNYKHCVLALLKFIFDNSDWPHDDMILNPAEADYHPIQTIISILTALIPQCGNDLNFNPLHITVRDSLCMLWSTLRSKSIDVIGSLDKLDDSSQLIVHACHVLESIFAKSLRVETAPSPISFLPLWIIGPHINKKNDKDELCQKQDPVVVSAPFVFPDFDFRSVNPEDQADLEVENVIDNEEILDVDLNESYFADADTVPVMPVYDESDGRDSYASRFSFEEPVRLSSISTTKKLGLRNMLNRLSEIDSP